MYVRKQYAIQHRDAQWQINEPVTFHFGDGSNAQLRKAPPGEQLPGGEGIALLFEVEVDCQPSAKRRAMLEALAGGKMPEGSKSLVPDPASPMFWADQDYYPTFADEKGELLPGALPPFDFLPGALRDFITETDNRLHDLANRTIRLLTWRIGAETTDRPLSPYTWITEWSDDRTAWHRLPSTGFEVTVSASFPPTVTAPAISSTECMLDDGVEEPMGRGLYREANSLRTQNPRSALLMLVAAAELALKQTISTLLPETQWLIENLPSPDLVTLADYLPNLPAKCTLGGRVLPLPANCRKELMAAVHARNQLAHRKPAALPPDSLARKFRAVNDLLWLLDYYCGRDWALEHMSPETRAELTSTSRA